MKWHFTVLIICVFTICCKGKSEKLKEESNKIDQILNVKDTIDFGDFIVYNIYKNQILVYRELKGEQDSLKIANKIIKNLFTPYPAIFKNCWTYSESNFIGWNTHLIKNDTIINERIKLIEQINLDAIIKNTYKTVSELSGYKPTGAWYIYIFSSPDGCDMCGCDFNSMQLNLSYTKMFEKNYIKNLLPHEFNHNIYDLTSKNDPDNNTVLWDVISEGFATYFAKKHSNLSISEAFMTYSKEDYRWCLENEKRIFEKAKPLLFSTNGKDYNELGTAERNSFMQDSPGRLGYFIGYRIIEEYVKRNGEDSWTEVYTIPIRKLLKESEYEKYIFELK